MGQGGLWSALPISKGPWRGGTPKLGRTLCRGRFCVGVMPHLTWPMGQAGHGGKGVLENA